MIKLSEIYNSLLTEQVDTNKLMKAIEEKRLVSIYYESPHDAGASDYPRGWRRIEPYCYGVNKFDNQCLRAWEEHGPSYSYPPGKTHDPLTGVPGWRMFRVDGITQFNDIGNDRFTTPRPKYNPDDKDMKIIYKSAQFGGPADASQPDPVTNPVQPTSAPTQAPSAVPTSTPTPAPSVSPFDSDKDNVTAPDNTATPDAFSNTSKPNWFQKFGDKFKNIVNFGKSDQNKI